MERNLKKILIAVLIIIAIILVVVFFVTDKKADIPVQEQKVEEQDIVEIGEADDLDKEVNIIEKEGVVFEKKPAKEIKQELTAEDLKKVSFSFAERFGSYSNQSNYGNMEDLKILMDEKMKVWIDSWLESLRAIDYSGSYYGVSTKALSGDVITFNRIGGEASILVTTKRRESKETLSNYTEFMQDILINFVKENGEWKTSGAFWQER